MRRGEGSEGRREREWGGGGGEIGREERGECWRSRRGREREGRRDGRREEKASEGRGEKQSVTSCIQCTTLC